MVQFSITMIVKLQKTPSKVHFFSCRKDTYVKLIFEETSNIDANANISDMDANINSSEQPITLLPK